MNRAVKADRATAAESSAPLEQPLEYEIDPAVQDALLAHPGKWAAITRSEVIAVEDNPDAALSVAKKRGYPSPILYWIPDRTTTYYF